MKKLNFPILFFSMTVLFSQTPSVEVSPAADTGNPPVSIRIKDMARVEGLRGNQLTGIGLVTGLSGQGDSPGGALLQYVLATFMTKQGINLDPSLLKSKNTGVVTVTCTLPPYIRPGDRADVTVASLGDAKNLEGGILLQTPLLGADGTIYATAQGRISIATAKVPNKTQGTIGSGLLMEKENVSPFSAQDSYSFLLNHPDFSSAQALGAALKKAFPTAEVKVTDASQVRFSDPLSKNDPVEFIAKAESLPIVLDFSSRVVLNKASGVVVMGRNVKIAPVALSVRGAKITLGNPKDKIKTEQVALEATTTVEDLVTMLQRIGVDTDTIIEVIKALDKAGALYGTVEIIGG